jgi:hypothetical protein
MDDVSQERLVQPVDQHPSDDLTTELNLDPCQNRRFIAAARARKEHRPRVHALDPFHCTAVAANEGLL